MFIGYYNYIFFLLIATGLLIIRYDVKGYKLAKLKKELKFARFVGWFNISLGILTFAINWIYENWFW
jgi:hypothetical protein